MLPRMLLRGGIDAAIDATAEEIDAAKDAMEEEEEISHFQLHVEHG